MRLNIYIALKILKRNIFHTFLSISAIVIVITTLFIIASISNGFEKEFIKNIISFSAHIEVYSKKSAYMKNYKDEIDKFSKIRNITSAIPVIEGQGLLETDDRMAGVRIIGYGKENRFKSLKKMLKKGNLPENEFDLIIGKELFNKLKLEIGNFVKIVSIGEDIYFKVVGVFDSGMYDYNTTIIFTNLKSMQKLMEIDDVTRKINIKIDDLDGLDKTVKKILKIGDFNITNYKEKNRLLISTFEMEKKIMFIISFCLLLISSFVIINSFILYIERNKKNIAILNCIGFTTNELINIFIIKSILIGFIGSIVGGFLGFISCKLLQLYSISIPSEVYFINTLPVEMHFSDFITILLFVLTISLFSCIIPSKNISKLKPVEIFRY